MNNEDISQCTASDFNNSRTDNLQLLDNVEQLDPLLILGLLAQRGTRTNSGCYKQWIKLTSTWNVLINKFGSGYLQ